MTGDELLDALPDGVLVADADGIITAANDTAREMLGQAELVGLTLAQVDLQDLEGNDWFTATAPYTGLRIRRLQAEQSWFRSDGTELLVTARFVRRSPAEPVERVAVSLRRARSRERLDLERSDLVTSIAHELRSPMTGVKALTASLLEGWERYGDEHKRLIMQAVHADTDRLNRLIAELLEVARIDTGRLSLTPVRMDALEGVEKVVDSVRAGSGGELVIVATADLPAVRADPDRFAQVMTNVVENAVRHGEGTITVDLRAVAEGGHQFVLIRVDDEGAGISPEIRSRVFTKFWKHGRHGGSGLGLYLVHGLVVAHHGWVRIGDAAQGGARVEIGWPADTGWPASTPSS